MLLRILVSAQRDHIQRAGLGDPGDALDGRLDGRRGDAEMVAQDRVGRFPADTLDSPLGEGVRAVLLDGPALQRQPDMVRRLLAGEYGVKVAHLAGDGRDGRRPAEEEALAAQHARRFQHPAQLGQQRPRVVGRQPVADADHVRVVGDDGIHEGFQSRRRAGEVCLVARFFGGGQEARDSGDVHAVAQAARQHLARFAVHTSLLCTSPPLGANGPCCPS